MEKFIPQKHISIEQSYLGFSLIIIKILKEKRYRTDDLWSLTKMTDNVTHSYEDFVLTLDYLFAVGVVIMDEEGFLCLS